jgi:subtilisin family serine protease
VTAPEWSDAFADPELVTALPLPDPIREWAWGGADGSGVTVAVVDSGVDAEHPLVGRVDGYAALEVDPDTDGGTTCVEDPHEDLVGHGTACAAIIRSLAPEVRIVSVRVLGASLKGQGAAFLAGIEWAVDHGVDVVNLSLSSKSPSWFGPLHDVADRAYFNRTLLVCAANNLPGPTYPSQYASVVSVAAQHGDDPWALSYNPHPPVEFAARGIDVEVAWSGGGSIVATGNSFAAPHVAGMAALVRSKHPGLTPFQVKSVLQALAQNARVRGP